LDGSPDVYADDDWAVDQEQVYTVVATKRTDLDTVQSFLIDNLGREIVVKDWKGVSWIVIVTNPGEVYTEDNEGYWTLVFQTTGDSVDGELVYDRLGLLEDLSRAGSIWTRQGTHDLGFTDRANRYYEETVVDDPLLSASLSDEATFTVETP
jgi:hypothetical protein